jgi:hypothetical protein
MSDEQQQHDDAAPAVSRAEMWTNAKGLPQWRVRVVDGATAESVDALVDLALRAHGRFAAAAGAAPAFTGEEPGAA